MMRAAWILLLAAIGVVVVGSELDRQARGDDAFVRLVPGPFRYFALQRKVLDEVRAGNSAAALDDAITLVRRRPMPAQSLTLLAMAQARGGDDAASRETILLAATRGWRSLSAQMASFQMALGAGDYGMAASRLAALWTLGTDHEMLVRLTRQLIASPQGREAFAQVLGAGQHWPDEAIRTLRTGIPAQDLHDIIGRAIAAGAMFDCRTLENADYPAKQAANGGRAQGQTPPRCIRN